MNPGDTRRMHPGRNRLVPPLNEGRGVNPGDTGAGPRSCRRRRPPLNEGRGVNPGDTRAAGPTPGRAATLNEGRGVNPGDTLAAGFDALADTDAQRRPGREPRRHLPDLDLPDLP